MAFGNAPKASGGGRHGRGGCGRLGSMATTDHAERNEARLNDVWPASAGQAARSKAVRSRSSTERRLSLSMAGDALGLLLVSVIVFELPAAGAHLAAPSPELTPKAVIDAHLEALGRNDQPHVDAGVEVAYRFASPELKAHLGGFAGFRRALHGPAFRPLMHRARALVDTVDAYGRKDEDHASVLVVTLDAMGFPVGFLFDLRRAEESPVRGCWLVFGMRRLDDVRLHQPAQERPVYRI